MKNKFDMHASIERMLASSGFDTVRIVNAVQSAKNDGSLLNDPDATAKDSGVKPASKGTEAKWTVAKREDYGAKMNDPLRFAAWNDSLAKHFKTHGEPHTELTDSVIPAGLYLWVEKFRQPATADAKSASNGSAPKGAKSAHRNGNIESVPAK